MTISGHQRDLILFEGAEDPAGENEIEEGRVDVRFHPEELLIAQSPKRSRQNGSDDQQIDEPQHAVVGLTAQPRVSHQFLTQGGSVQGIDLLKDLPETAVEITGVSAYLLHHRGS